MKYVLLLIAVVISPCHAAADWKPPENPDERAARAVIHEAFADTRAGRYEESLAKHVWYHQHALEIAPHLVGSRLAPALMDWYDLAKVYPPAMAKLKETRDIAVKQVVEHKGDIKQAFQDLSSINENLSEEDKTVDLFLRLDKEAPDAAKTVYDFAELPLVKAKKYKVCGKYLEPKETYKRMVEHHRMDLELNDERKVEPSLKQEPREGAERYFLKESAILVALLALNDRKPEAKEIADDVRKISKHPKSDVVIAAALEGKVPELDWEKFGEN